MTAGNNQRTTKIVYRILYKTIIMQKLKFGACSFLFLLLAFSSVGQQITAHNEFRSTKAQKTIPVEDDLYLRISLEQPLEQLIKEQEGDGQDVYGVLKIDFDGLEFLTDAFALGSTKAASIDEFDVALSVNMKEFHALAMDYKDSWGPKDDLLLYVLSQKNNPLVTWMRAVAARALPVHTHSIKVALYVMKDKKEPYDLATPLATGSFDLTVGKNALLPLYGTKIPAMYQPVKDNGLIDDLHQENVTNILWSTQFVPIKDVDKKLLQSTFKTTEETVYGRIYLPKSIQNLNRGVGESKSCSYTTHYYIDGVLIESVDVELTASICEKETSLPIVLWGRDSNSASKFRTKIQELKAGEHTVKVVVDLKYKEGNESRTLPLANSVVKLIK